MSYELGLTTRITDLPSAQAWAGSAAELGYEIDIEDIDWESHAGYLPMKLCGRDCGFELYRDSVIRKRLIGSKATGEWRIAFRLGPFEHELAVAMASLHALCQIVEGDVWADGVSDYPRKELEADARETYLDWRILYARELQDEAGLPAGEPPLSNQLETEQSRIRRVESLCERRQLERAMDDGWFRLSESVQAQLAEDRKMRGLD